MEEMIENRIQELFIKKDVCSRAVQDLECQLNKDQEILKQIDLLKGKNVVIGSDLEYGLYVVYNKRIDEIQGKTINSISDPVFIVKKLIKFELISKLDHLTNVKKYENLQILTNDMENQLIQFYLQLQQNPNIAWFNWIKNLVEVTAPFARFLFEQSKEMINNTKKFIKKEYCNPEMEMMKKWLPAEDFLKAIRKLYHDYFESIFGLLINLFEKEDPNKFKYLFVISIPTKENFYLLNNFLEFTKELQLEQYHQHIEVFKLFAVEYRKFLDKKIFEKYVDLKNKQIVDLMSMAINYSIKSIEEIPRKDFRNQFFLIFDQTLKLIKSDYKL